jgi:hypothetical protein
MNHFRCIGLAIDFKCAKLFYFNVNQGLSLLFLSMPTPQITSISGNLLNINIFHHMFACKGHPDVRKVWQTFYERGAKRMDKEGLSRRNSPGEGRGSLLWETGSVGPGSRAGRWSVQAYNMSEPGPAGSQFSNERSCRCIYCHRSGCHS